MVRYQKIKEFVGVVFLFLGDFCFLLFALLLTYQIRIRLIPFIYKKAPFFHFRLEDYWWILTFWMGILLYEKAYTKRLTYWDEVKLLWKCSLLSTIITVIILFAQKKAQTFPRTIILGMPLVTMTIWPFWRFFLKKLLYRLGFLKRKIIIAGTGNRALRILRALKSEPNLGYEVAGFIAEDKNAPQEIEGLKVHGYLDRVDRYIKNCHISDVVIALDKKDENELASLINRIQHRAVNVLYVPEVCGISVLCTELKHFFSAQTLALEIHNNLEAPLNYFLKRTMDYFGAILILPVLLPVMALIAMLIKLDSPGPVLFIQERLGKGGRRFRCYKFRTMYIDAEKRLKDLLARDPEARAEWEKYWKLKNDPRVTRVGRFLRRTSLDELPQIFNVLKGEMSLVGPRPYLPREENKMAYYKKTILLVPPGITGLWQVSGRNQTTYKDRLALDAWYVRNWTPWLDLIILLKTVKVVLFREGAY